MAEIIPFRKPLPGRGKSVTKGNTLCRHGHHKWVVDKAKQFDVKQGKLVTIYHCIRCGKNKVETH